MVTDISAFSATYAEARRKFLALAADRHANVMSVVHPTERGAEGEELAIDVATFGDPGADKTLFIVSGTHGQEGFLGSALQIAFLRELEIPEGVNIVALHALNPWGFSHRSRTDEANIDLNRNFNTGASNLVDDELYPILFRAMCPDDWTEETIDWSGVRDKVVADHGFKRMITILAGGQNIEPTGLNFVGTGPSSVADRRYRPVAADFRKGEEDRLHRMAHRPRPVRRTQPSLQLCPDRRPMSGCSTGWATRRARLSPRPSK